MKSSEKDCVSIRIQMYKSEDYHCDKYVSKRRGLPKQMVSQISTLIGTEPNVQPGQTKMNIMHQQMNTTIDDGLQLTINSSEERKSVGAQIANCFNHNKNKAKKNGTIADACALVGDVVKLKDDHLFTPPDQPSTNLKTESYAQELRAKLSKEGKLKVFDTLNVTDKVSNAYQMMTTLDFLPNNDDTRETQEEKELYEHIMK